MNKIVTNMTFFSNITKFCGVEFIFSPKPSPPITFKKRNDEGSVKLINGGENELEFDFVNFTGTVVMRKDKNMVLFQKEIIDLNTPTPCKGKKPPASTGARSAVSFSHTPTPGKNPKQPLFNKTNTPGSAMSIESYMTENSLALLSPPGTNKPSPLFKDSDERCAKKESGVSVYDSETEDELEEAFDETQQEDFPPAGCGRAEKLTIDLLEKLEMKKKK